MSFIETFKKVYDPVLKEHIKYSVEDLGYKLYGPPTVEYNKGGVPIAASTVIVTVKIAIDVKMMYDGTDYRRRKSNE